ncbi:MAG: M23 family peptidase [Acidobacteria bacterium]|nr:MAG: M23 family peptidase [Acidobacteriota bacterium]
MEGDKELRNRAKATDAGIGAGTIVVLILLLVSLIVLVVALARNPAPAIRIKGQIKGLGAETKVAFEVSDPGHRIRRVDVSVSQEGHSFAVPHEEAQFGEGPRPWWKFWAPRGENSLSVVAMAGRKTLPELHEGRATLVIEATNDSWGRFFRGGRSQVLLDLPVRFTPPRADVLSIHHYINQGGAELVVFRVSPGTIESGVEVGRLTFPSWPVKESTPEIRFALFALPYDSSPAAPIRIVAGDEVGNRTLADFQYRIFPRQFHKDTIQVTDEFMNRVVPPIMSQTPGLEDQGSLVKNFLLVNGHLRAAQAEKLVELSHQTHPQFLWTEPFIELPSKVEAAFADYRTYVYNGQAIDHQTHLGFDLAGFEHMPVRAANDGAVVLADFFGIFGNAVLLDHGCGLQTLYGHLSSIEVKAGESVRRGQEIGKSGQTGLAGGDHLHFTVLLDGIPINPTEWWDPHWIHDRIEAKLAPYK